MEIIPLDENYRIVHNQFGFFLQYRQPRYRWRTKMATPRWIVIKKYRTRKQAVTAWGRGILPPGL